MPSITSDARFLGIDLHALWREIRQTWSGMHDWPLLSWLTPAVPVVLLHPVEGQSLWRGESSFPQSSGFLTARFTAVALPEEYVLRREMILPAMAAADVASAVALEARANSPFAPQDLVYGYRVQTPSQGGHRVELALASRRQIGLYLESQSSRLEGVAEPEVWVRNLSSPPTVLEGYGEGLRKAYIRRQRNAGYSLLALAMVLLSVIAITPTLQLRMRALEAAAAYQDAVRRTAPLVKEREGLMQSIETIGALSEVLSGRIEPLKVLDRLTQVLPDDTAVQSFKLQGLKVTLVGVTANASALMQLLGDQPGLRDVKAPSAATRLGGATKENFVIEFMLDPQQFGVVDRPLSGAPSADPLAKSNGSVAPPPVMPSSAAVAPAGAASAAVAPASKAAAPMTSGAGTRAGGATFGGGRASFGGGRVAPASSPAVAASGSAP
ncbi:PilN domain-containing protein [Diaphorobacter nitroreducens]|uniref:PilN domain-containing protein n=1 Tax=Diaphorobacter nitroreducens TaxID=164759 RepID=UPI00289C625F|nr:PilN domain-containing protein [Diaphorobacter nitroreducens]